VEAVEQGKVVLSADHDIGVTLRLCEDSARVFEMSLGKPGAVSVTIDVEEERTPVNVLRAMWSAYSQTALDAEVDYFSIVNDDVQAHLAAEHRDEMADAADAVRGELSAMLAGNHTRFDWPQWIHADYEARLRGERPLNAPPMETP
jgi:hypothetical protein